VAAADVCSGVAACVCLVMSLAYVRTDLTYDEAVYLRLARTITECGLPLRRAYDNFTQFRLFENNPPLITYVASLSQLAFPGHDVPARLVHILAFALPTYLLVWAVARANFGPWAALASLVVLLTNVGYMRETTHVLLNVPLGLLACMALTAFHAAVFAPNGRVRNVLVAALALALAAWTKYQAVCVPIAIAGYVIYLRAKHGSKGIRAARVPLATVIVSGAASVVVLFWFYWAFGGGGTLTDTIGFNSGRISTASMSARDVLRAVVETVQECERTLGGAVLLLAAFATVAEQRHRGLIVLLASFVVTTIAFNLFVFRLPGAGESYLYSAVPALALLAGPGAERLVGLAASMPSRVVLAVTVILVSVGSSGTAFFEPPRPNGSHVAADYIAAHSTPTAGVLAETVAVEFYSGRPVRAIGKTYPREIVLRSLDGTSGDDISFVITDAKAPPRNLGQLDHQWDTLLARYFEPVAAGIPGLRVHRRKPR